MRGLSAAADTAIAECLAMKAGERLLIVTNPGTEQEVIAEALKAAALSRAVRVSLLLQPVKSQSDFAEDFILEAIAAKPDALASISTDKLGKDRYSIASPLQAPDGKKYDHIFNYLLHGTKEMRAFWSPGTTIDMFSRTVAIDYSLMRARAKGLAAILDEAAGIQVSAPAGTDIFIGAEGRKAFIDDGDFGKPGTGGNLPAGEVFLSPALRTAEGTIVFDGSIADIAGDIVIETPVSCAVSGGFVLGCEGGAEAAGLEAALRKGMDMASALVGKGGMSPEEALRYATNARHVGELGIGLNTEALITGRMLEDEKAYGSCHFAIGYNYDEDAPAMIHLDGLVKQPTITVFIAGGPDIILMRDGVIQNF
ncbi:MAG: peptidase M17 [Rectinemataceae bacterium]|nr:peptidase M17 [Rectinemataceae bacterium]